MRFDRPVLLYGAGREARSTRAFLKEVAPDTPVFVTTDDGKAVIEDTTYIGADDLPEAIFSGEFGLIVKSPGVSIYKPIFDTARVAHVPVTSNLNLWGEHFRDGRTIIAITGTKGKSTTATLVHLMLKHSGIENGLAGNVGVAPLDMRDSHDTVVFELSSYQTADLAFEPDYAAITNLYPEHIDWHGSTDRYYADKLNLIRRRSGKMRVALSVQAHDEEHVREALDHNTRRINVLNPIIEDAIVVAAKKSRLKGAHNLENARLAARLTLAAGGDLDGILAGIAEFAPLPHRLEEHKIGDKLFVDDSISTTSQATIAALQAYEGKRIALLAGGHERQQDYGDLLKYLQTHPLPVLICLPVTGERIARAAEESLPDTMIMQCETLEAAMKALANAKTPFDTVILSPGAPSYNQFKNFEERGARFIALAEELFA